MERIGTVLSRSNKSATTLLRQPCSDELAVQLGRLMAEAQAMKPTQTLPPGTPDMYLQAWEELVQEYGVENFTQGLWKALRSSPFIPSPDEIQAAIETLKAADRETKRKQREQAELAEHALYLKDIKDHPANYVSIAELMAEYKSKRTEAK